MSKKMTGKGSDKDPFEKKKSGTKSEKSHRENSFERKPKSSFQKKDNFKGKDSFSSGKDKPDFKKKDYEKTPSFGKPFKDRKDDSEKRKPSAGKYIDYRKKDSDKKPSFVKSLSKDKRDYTPSKGKTFSSRDNDSDKKEFVKKSSFEKKPFRDKKDFNSGREKSFSGRNTDSGKKDFDKKPSFEKKPFRDKKDFNSGREKFSSGRNTDLTKKDFDKKPFERYSKKDLTVGKEKSFSGRNKDSEKKSFDRKTSNGKSSFAQKKDFKGKERSFSKRKDKDSEETYSTPQYNLIKPKKSKKEDSPASSDDKIRLNRYIANSGVCSRREADELIGLGEITVNGKVITELGYKVDRSDVVKYDKKVLNPEKPVYVLLNKPKDFITTTEDPQERKTVMSLVANACKERIYPVGRLDRNTTGLLLLTNDGELAKKLTHPSSNIKKLYQADLDKPLIRDDFEKILNGLELEDGPVHVDALAFVSDDKRSIGIELHEGRNRIVRRIFEHLGYEVVKLDRVMYAGLTKKDLPRGKWKFLSEKEVVKIKFFL